MAEVEGSEWVTSQGKAQVEHVPLETYDFTFAGKNVNANQQTSYGFVKRGKF
jgi:hypothetical protein